MGAYEDDSRDVRAKIALSESMLNKEITTVPVGICHGFVQSCRQVDQLCEYKSIAMLGPKSVTDAACIKVCRSSACIKVCRSSSYLLSPHKKTACFRMDSHCWAKASHQFITFGYAGKRSWSDLINSQEAVLQHGAAGGRLCVGRAVPLQSLVKDPRTAGLVCPMN
jgi:hypothetical protein